MSQPIPLDPDGDVIDVGRTKPRRRRIWRWVLLAAIIILFIAGSRALSIYLDRKSTRLNSSHLVISYAVFCLKKKKTQTIAPLSPTASTAVTAAATPSRAAMIAPQWDTS